MTVAEAMDLTDARLTVVGLRRGRDPHPPFGIREEILQGGDTLLLAGPWKPLRQLQKGGHDLVALESTQGIRRSPARGQEGPPRPSWSSS